MIILIHSSKTMRPPALGAAAMRHPELLTKASVLAHYLKTLSVGQLIPAMNVSGKLADTICTLLAGWTDDPELQRPAIDSFLGDIYSGLQVQDWTDADRQYADQTVRILSGLYGIIRPLDGIYPYRLEMGYKLPDKRFTNLYNYWGTSIVDTLPVATIINLSAVEYAKTITKYRDPATIITPSFLTVNPKTGKPTFVTVHTKIARGAFARWLIKNRVTDPSQITQFTDLNYTYDQSLSTTTQPVFVCQTFGGIGLSVRLT